MSELWSAHDTPPLAARRPAAALTRTQLNTCTHLKSDLRVAALQELKELIDRVYRSHASKVIMA